MLADQKSSSVTGDKIKARILEFDVLRAVAILLLILHHGGIYNFRIEEYSLLPMRNIVALFLLGTFLFLSGYFLVQSLERRGMWDFWRDKFTRLVIPYWIAILLFIVVLEATNNPLDILIHFTGSQMVLAPRFTTPVLTLWYISLTLVYYLIFGFLLIWIRKPLHILMAAFVVYGVAALLRMKFGLFDHRFFDYFFVFGAGVFLAKTDWLKRLGTTRFLLLDKLVLFALSFVILYPLRNHIRDDVRILVVFAITFFILSSILLSLSVLKLVVKIPLVYHFFSVISTASFFAYLLHRPIWGLLIGTGTTLSRLTLSIYLLLIGFFVVIPVSYFLQIGYDRVIDWFTGKRRKAPLSFPEQGSP